MKICSVCQHCCEDSAADCEENHVSLVAARSGIRQITADYRLDFLLERDAAGETYQATRSGFDQPFIVKILAPNLTSSAARREKIQSEAQVVANLNHPHLVRVCESGTTDGDEFYIVTEAVGGQTLRECLRNVGVLPEAKAVEVAEQTAEALEAARAVGVIHRAVSPANIILVQDKEKLSVKLQNFDFGGIRQQISVAGLSTADPPIDRLRYLAPEQCAGETADARSDVYSLSVVLYEMLCGHSPFGAPTPAAIAERRVNEQPLEQLGFDTRALLKHILRQSLQKRPEVRPPTAGNVARQLRHIKQLLGLPGMDLRDTSPPSPPNQSAAAALNNPPRPELIESPPEKYQQRRHPSREIAGVVLPAVAAAAQPDVEKIEESAIRENTINAPTLFPEPKLIDRGENEFDAGSFAAQPILVRKKEARDISAVSAPVFTGEKFEAEPIVVKKKQIDAPALESAPIPVKRKNTGIVSEAPEIINLPDADVAETKERQETAPIFTDSLNEKRARRFSTAKRPLFIGAGLLALLVSVLLGALLDNRQRQSPIAPPTTAQSAPVPAASQSPEIASGRSDDAAVSDVPESGLAAETAAPDAIEKLPQTAARRENQPREEMPTVANAAKQNESPKNQTAREIPAAATESAGDHSTRPRIVSEGGNAQAELNTSLADWVTATNTRNVDRQMNYYAPKVNSYYRTKNVSPETVRAEKKRIFERADTVDIQTGKPEIAVSPDGKTATMRFRKKYVIKKGQKSNNGEVLQELQWVKSGSGWRIVSERDVKVINR